MSRWQASPRSCCHLRRIGPRGKSSDSDELKIFLGAEWRKASTPAAPDDLLSIKQIADLAQVKTKTIQNRKAKSSFPKEVFSGLWRYSDVQLVLLKWWPNLRHRLPDSYSEAMKNLAGEVSSPEDDSRTIPATFPHVPANRARDLSFVDRRKIGCSPQRRRCNHDRRDE